jgi:cell division protein ZapD
VQALASYRGNPSIAQSVLDEVLQQIEQCYSKLNGLTGKAGHILTENDWLMSIRSRIGIPGGTCAFDLPAYYAWQQEAGEQRRADLQGWITTFTPLAEAIGLLLTLLRDSGIPQKVMATGGQFQQALPQGRTFQLLRMNLDAQQGLIPEISGNRLIVSIRFMRMGEDQRLHPSSEDSSFDLTLCS